MSSCNDVMLVALAAVALVAAPRRADACGPDFDIELLSQRVTTMAELEDGVFLDEATRLVPPPARRYAVLAGEDGPRQLAGESATERALYAVGADAFHADRYDDAERAFAQLLALPPALRRHRSTWAAYSLARLGDGDAAIARYRQVRELVDAGYLDEGGLAASSLGQEARLHADPLARVRLYAEQAALGHPDGGTSLLFVVRGLIDRGEEDAILDDPLGQRLLAAYLYARSDELDPPTETRLWDALLRRDAVAGADRLAAAAYRRGDWSLARRLAARAEDVPLTRRVRAKLALRDGDDATAEALLASIDDGRSAPVCGERTVLAAAEGRFTDAMDRAWPMRYRHPDALYLAERVLTVDELRPFVDALPRGDAGDGRWAVDTVTMRGILARRLMRAGRFAEAMPYVAPRHLLHAMAYAGALARARHGDAIERAEALFDASLVARRHGLELLGTAHAPDWEHYDASYDVTRYTSDEDPGRWRGPAELRRVAASAPSWPARYHYRHVASLLAEQAADLLPARTQAFAATLCWSARHVRNTDEARYEAMWERYVDEGAWVEFVGDFGQTCPAPEFERARRSLPVPDAPAWQLIATALVCFLGGMLLWRRLRPPRGLGARA